MSEQHRIPDPIANHARTVRDEHDFSSIGEAIRHMTQDYRVGDMELAPTQNGTLAVYRHHDYIGDITAQGLQEAAELPDEELSNAWLAHKQDGDNE